MSRLPSHHVPRPRLTDACRGEAVTVRADVYAAALLAWRLATGRTPFAKFKDD